MLNSGIIKKVVSTWKSEKQRKDINVYTFYVDPLVNKFQLREVLEKTFDVRVESISSLRRKPMLKNSRHNIWTKLRKKVFVKLKKGYKIGEELNSEELKINTSNPPVSDLQE